jgi:hypothetical protein
MSGDALGYFNQLMASLEIPYAFIEWKEKPPDDRYWVSDYTESAMTTMEEDGRQETTIFLRGFTRREWMLLERDKETIKKHITITAILPNGNGIALFYEGAQVVPTWDAELKSIKINLKMQEWSVN